ncbi:MAG: TonB-dependent receptor [Candidatus Nitricoxidivorans perseverans]|uniref:TonB-dependent receptor n=1 Tax=Candidatus Nitricoxidivorans perseverans TaxID=2975601 RepID=A0AA49FJD2_9PROT|nr:MAG: TonB-dependent receptor [Candidatus Nitricoxidivorans perseverans]
MFRSKPFAPFNRPRKLVATALILAFHAGAVLAGPTAKIDIPAQPLSSALRAFASQAGIQLIFTPETVGAAKSVAVKGEMSVEAALRQLLSGSGLEFRQDGERNYVVVRPARTEYGMPEMVVTATRTERRVDDVPASVSVITAKDIATQRPQHIADLLRNVEGVDVAVGGSPADIPTITIRGISTSFAGATSQVLIDGMPIESPVTGIHRSMHALDLNDLERVEVVRGPASALYGPSAVGGVVNFLPKRWKGAPGAEVSIGTGSHDATLVSAAVGGAWDAVDFRLSASDYRTDGYVAQPEPDIWGTKDLAPRDGKNRKISLSAGLRPADNQEITLAVRKGDTESAWLGGHPNYRFDDNAESYDLGYRYETGDWGVFKARYRKMRQKTRILYDADFWGWPADLSLAEIDHRTDTSDVIDLQADLRLSKDNVLTLGFNNSLGEYSSTADYDPVIVGFPREQSVSKSRLTGVFIQDEHRVSEALTVLVGGRWDHYKLFGDSIDGVPTGKDSKDSVFNPRLGARYRLNDATSLYATAGTAYVPALNSLKFRTGGAWLDSPNLKPETSASYEVGANHRIGAWSMRAALFHTEYEDKISVIWVGPKRQYQNIGKVSVDGLELAIEGTAGDWRPYANYAYTDSIIKENSSDPLTVGKQLQRVAPHKLNLGVTYAPLDRFYARVSGRYVGDYYFNDRNTDEARNPGHFVADAKFGWRLPTGGIAREAELSLAINNLFDKRYREQWLESVKALEYMDGRNVWLGLNARF